MEKFRHLLPQWLDIAQKAARQGGFILEEFWGNLQDVQDKGISGDLVTEADRSSEKVVLEIISKHFPDHQILAEESGLSEHSSEFVWVVDPLDGTVNYTHQFPMAAVSIGLLYKQNSILGVIYNPFTDELFTAAKGLGAALNGAPIHVSKVEHLEASLLASGFAYDRRTNPDNNYAEFCHFTNLTQGVRRAGAASLDLAYLACGRVDGYWERGIKPWDIAAGAIIVQEAGGSISDYDLTPLDFNSGRILASNGLLQNAMSHELMKLRKAP